jgi:hypothetical protein
MREAYSTVKCGKEASNTQQNGNCDECPAENDRLKQRLLSSFWTDLKQLNKKQRACKTEQYSKRREKHSSNKELVAKLTSS